MLWNTASFPARCKLSDGGAFTIFIYALSVHKRLSWASLVAQLVKNPPAIQETWVRFLGWKDPLEKGKATHSSILAWRSPWAV